MRACCVVALFISAASADIRGCVQNPDASDSCREAIPLGDATSLLQVGNLKTTSGEHVSRVLTDDCAEGSCTLGQWSVWTACSKTCGFGTRSRSRDVTGVSKDSSECGCLEQTEICSSGECPVAPQSLVKVCGKVKSVADNKVVAGATVKYKESEKTSDADGKFCFEDVPEGEATFTSTKEGWVDDEEKITVSGEETEVILEMTPKMEADEWRIVLRWGAQSKKPADLDSVTYLGTKTWGEDCKVNYNDKGTDKLCAKNKMSSKLELDHCYPGDYWTTGCDTSSESTPETTWLNTKECTTGCLVYFKVDHFSFYSKQDPVSLEESKATVTLYNGDHVANTFKVGTHGVIKSLEKNGKNYQQWFVFSLDTQTKQSTAITAATFDSACDNAHTGYCEA